MAIATARAEPPRRDATLLLAGEAARHAGVRAIGGKAAGLLAVEATGAAVPPWCVLPATALAGIALESREAQRLAHDAARAAIELLGDVPLAVRSSAADEDGDAHSFAGQFVSILDVRGADAVADAVLACWRSAASPRVRDYRARNGLAGDAATAVVIQQLVAADAAGVVFTADPVTGDRTRLRVSACRGLGEGVVGGEHDVDEFVLDRTGAALEQRIVGEAPAIDAAVLRELTRVALDIEAAAGAPRDIEFAVQGGRVYVLQSRPITSLRDAPAPDGRRTVWDNSNIQESYCGVTTPLTFSFASAAYASVYEQTMRAVGLPERTIAAYRPLLANLLGLIRGRVYYNLDNWYRGLLLLPSFGRNKADMERMMGVEEPVDFVTDERLTLGERIRRTPRLLRTLAALLAHFARLDREVPRWLARFDAEIAAVRRGSLDDRTLDELFELLDRLRERCLGRWSTPIINDFHVMMATGRLRRLVERAAPGEADRNVQVLLGGADVAVSAAPAMLMLELATIARAEPGVAGALRAREAAAALAGARAASSEFARRVEELLDRFGDRCMGELKLESRPLRDDPAFLVRVLRNYLDQPPQDPRALAEAARVERTAAEYAIGLALGRFHRRRFRAALDTARRAIRRREEMRLARTRLFGAHRDVYRAIGRRLHAMGRLATPDDIFWLTTSEIAAFREGTTVSADLRAIVSARRAEFARYERMEVPNRIVTFGPPDAWLDAHPIAAASAPAPTSGATLRGLGCSAGVAEGPVRIVRGPDDDLALAGHVLVAQRTDPGWSPLFPSATAIVVERGSILSHSAVLARELGLPAVVGIPGLLATLRDGERVRVDGVAGTVERLDA